ncbi:hypothetical protein MTO96_023298 [Rhipicephalus appendiculatus]
MGERDDEFDSRITNWERECIEELERAPDLESQIQNERDRSSQKLWLLFQSSATCVAQLYKDRHHEVSLWAPFQNAASSVTDLYKECLETQHRVSELDFQSGYQRCIKDILAWVRKCKRHIRREDLLSFLCGMTPHQHHQYHGWTSPRPHQSLEPRVAVTAPPSSMLSLAATGECSTAVALGSGRGHSGDSVSPPEFCSAASLSSFTADECARQFEPRKRTAPENTTPGDVVMDSPTPKRSRLI